jgi:hypothetical protein
VKDAADQAAAPALAQVKAAAAIKVQAAAQAHADAIRAAWSLTPASETGIGNDYGATLDTTRPSSYAGIGISPTVQIASAKN